MKRFMLGVAICCAAAIGVPAQADNAAPCATQDGALSVSAGAGQAGLGDAFSCSYVTATSTQGLLVATPLSVSVTGTHKDAEGSTVTDFSETYGGTTPGEGQGPFQLAIPAGDTITVTMSADCVPSDPTGQGCGWVGAVAVGDTPA